MKWRISDSTARTWLAVAVAVALPVVPVVPVVPGVPVVPVVLVILLVVILTPLVGTQMPRVYSQGGFPTCLCSAPRPVLKCVSVYMAGKAFKLVGV